MQTVPPPSSLLPFQKSFAVAIGINAYGHGIEELHTAVNDARRIGEVLQREHGYDTVTLLDGEATRARIVSLVTEELPAKVGPDDRVCFYFAGHGVAVNGDQGPNGYLLPVDAKAADVSSFLDMPLVHDALMRLTCRHMLVILDSCFSGAFRWSGTRAFTPAPEVIHQERFDRFVRDPAWQVITSASKDEKAIDQLVAGQLGTRDSGGEHSPFALALLEALAGQGDIIPRAKGDGVITTTELFLYVKERLQTAALEAGKRQTAQLWPLTKHEEGEFIFLTPGAEVNLPKAEPLTFDRNPWKGLASYEASDASLFFGRSQAIEALTAQVKAKPFVAVLGASGTGKSSLVRAGVLPKIKSDSRWHVLEPARPGTAPFEALSRAVAPLASGVPPATAAGVLGAVATWVAANPGRQLLLVLDQTEELVTMAPLGADRNEVPALLARLLEAHPLAVSVLVTLRTDFEPQFDRSALSKWWTAGRYVVPPMTRKELKEIIERPASERVLYFENTDLIERLLDDVTNNPGGLPLLSFALSEMYIRYVTRQSNDRMLTRKDYDDLGGVVGALRCRADAEFDGLDPAHQASMQRLMLRMVSGGAGSLVKRRVSDAELEFADPDETARIAEVANRLTNARLIVQGKEADGEGYVEAAHDALVRGWVSLKDWMDAVNASPVPLATRQKLATEALEWKGKADAVAKKGMLWSDSTRSALLLPLVRDKAPWMNAHEFAFAERSVRGRRNARYAAIAVTIAMTVLGIASLVFAVQSSRNAAQARVQEQAAQAAAEKAQAEEKRAEWEAMVASLEKERAVRSLFSSLKLYMRNGNAGSVCTFPGCQSAPKGDGDETAWFTIASLPEDLEGVTAPDGTISRNFIAAREFGIGHVLVYAQDGLTRDDEIAGRGADNLVFAENALRWLDGYGQPPECPAETKIVYWAGTFLQPAQMTAVQRFIARRGWSFVVTEADRLAEDLKCASVFWYASDWEPPANFATTHVPLVEQFVLDGGGLLVGGLGWSYADQGPADVPYAADQLGEPFGFKFSLNAFQSDPNKPIPLLMQ